VLCKLEKSGRAANDDVTLHDEPACITIIDPFNDDYHRMVYGIQRRG
jgi:hypothetical protein